MKEISHNYKFNQENLELMSLEKELITDEAHDTNDFYGQASLIRKYAKYSRPIKVVYEHSLPIHNLIWDHDKRSSLEVAFVSSNFRLDIYKEQKVKKYVFNIGSVLNYAISLSDPDFAKNNYKSNAQRTGSIYFPSHSTHHIKSTIDSDNIISKLQKLPDIYKPITICMYWKDIQHGEHENYLKHGFKIVSAGHIYDALFYYRLFDILKNFKYTLGSSFGSFIFHAARSGSLVVFPKELENLKEDYVISTENFVDKDLENRLKIANEFDKKVCSLFSERIEKYSFEQLQFIEHYCSSKTLSPLKLKSLLLFAEFIYFKNRVINKLKSIIK